MTLFRFHRGGLEESLATTIIIKSRNELMQAIKDRHKKFSNLDVNDFCIVIGPYPDPENCFDSRIGWYTQMVTCDILERGVFMPEGFLSEPLNN